MILTKAEIEAQSANLVSDLLPALRQYQIAAECNAYQLFVERGFTDIKDRLAAVSGIPAQMCLAAMVKIEAIGSDTSRKKGGASAIDYDPMRNRDSLIELILTTLEYRLFDTRRGSSGGSVDITATGF